MPRPAPTSTSTGVWPSSSRSRISGWPRWAIRSSTRRLSTAACRPAARRTPAASYMTTNEKIRAIAKLAEPHPFRRPRPVVSPITMALCELGIPPISASTARLSRRCCTDLITTLAVWATSQASSGGSRYFTTRPASAGRARGKGTREAVRPARAGGVLRSARQGGPRPPPAAGSPPGRCAPALREGRGRPPAARSPPPGGRGGGRSAPRSRSGGDPAQDAVHESARLLAREGLGQLDRLVDGGFGRHPAVDGDLVDRDPEQHAVDLRHLLEPPVLGCLRDGPVPLLPVPDDPTHELVREGAHVVRRAHLVGVVAEAALGVLLGLVLELEEHFQGQLPRLVPAPGGPAAVRRRRRRWRRTR